jgi:hypothetical protein
MSSTRNRNTPGDYKLESSLNQSHVNYNTYGSYGVPTASYFPGNGLVQGRVASENLSGNACDIESFLRGIGSTNLVNPQPEVRPEIYSLKSLSIIDKTPLIIPSDLVIDANQRPLRN